MRIPEVNLYLHKHADTRTHVCTCMNTQIKEGSLCQSERRQTHLSKPSIHSQPSSPPTGMEGTSPTENLSLPSSIQSDQLTYDKSGSRPASSNSSSSPPCPSSAGLQFTELLTSSAVSCGLDVLSALYVLTQQSPSLIWAKAVRRLQSVAARSSGGSSVCKAPDC